MLLRSDNAALVKEYDRIASVAVPSQREKFYTEDKEALEKIKQLIRQNEEIIDLIENYYILLYR